MTEQALIEANQILTKQNMDLRLELSAAYKEVQRWESNVGKVETLANCIQEKANMKMEYEMILSEYRESDPAKRLVQALEVIKTLEFAIKEVRESIRQMRLKPRGRTKIIMEMSRKYNKKFLSEIYEKTYLLYE